MAHGVATYVRDSAAATFPLVEPGIALRFEVYDHGIRRGVTHELAPLGRGEVRQIEVVLGETLPHVIGRIVDEAGAPVPARSIDIEFEPSGSARVYQVDADGGFALSVTRLQSAGNELGARLNVELRGQSAQQHLDVLEARPLGHRCTLCLSTLAGWCARRDSNPRRPDPKSGALSN